MMLKTAFPIALLIAAAPALAQQAPASAPPAAVQQAMMAFNQCVMAGVQGLAADVTPDAGAATALAGCAQQQEQLDQAITAHIGTMPADQQPAALERFRAARAGIQGQIAAAIRQMRG